MIEETAEESTWDIGGTSGPDDTGYSDDGSASDESTNTGTDGEEDESDDIIDDDDEGYDGDIEGVDFGFDPENISEEPISRTYGLDLIHHRIKGFVDEKEAVMQSIWKILSTVRYANHIYDDTYGCDIMNRIYNSSLSDAYLNTDIPAMVEEALEQDDRIKGVKDFIWEKTSSDGVKMTFTVETIYGDMPIESEV